VSEPGSVEVSDTEPVVSPVSRAPAVRGVVTGVVGCFLLVIDRPPIRRCNLAATQILD
jgi:hypothetical protein